jgi:aldose 1-epimerase
MMKKNGLPYKYLHKRMNRTQAHTFRVLSPNHFNGLIGGQAVALFTLSNRQGAFVKVCNYGARIVQIVMPDAKGDLGDVALGFNTLADVQRASPEGVPSMGAFIGRYANRIAGGQFSLDGLSYQLPQNSAEHCIHGGVGGSRYAVFTATQTADNELVLHHRFTSENDGFPGAVNLTVTYHLSGANALSVAWHALAVDAPTVASFTSHVFFNLSLGATDTVADHSVQLRAAHYLPLKTNLVPTGEILPVKGTPFDFRQAKRVGQEVHSAHPQMVLCGGYDHHFAIDDWDGRLKKVARVRAPQGARRLTVYSTEPGIQLFTANGLDEALCGFARHSGLCLEPSYFPDSPNQPAFPSTRLAAGQSRRGQIIYDFHG